MKKYDINRIKRPIERELDDFEAHFRDSMRSKVSLLDKIMFYIVQRKGKQVRPMFVFLSAKLKPIAPAGKNPINTFSANRWACLEEGKFNKVLLIFCQ